jgi:hypothetical protein
MWCIMCDSVSCVMKVIREVALMVNENKYISDNRHISSVVYINKKCITIIVHNREAFLLHTKHSTYCCVSGSAILKVRKPVITVKHL